MADESPDDESTRLEDSLLEIILGGAVSFFGIIGGRLAGFAEKILVARFLDSSRYGQIVIALAILSLGSTIGMLGLKTAVVRYLPRFDDARRKRGGGDVLDRIDAGRERLFCGSGVRLLGRNQHSSVQ
jgi:hypothetical protein